MTSDNSGYAVANREIVEIRWHGRGGQGTVTAAHIMAEAAFLQGYQGVMSMPAFGAERRGALVNASTRFSHQPIRIYSQIETPDVVVVLDETLLQYPSIIAGLKVDGWLIVNSPSGPDELSIDGNFNMATADCTSICRELGITFAGAIVVNTAIMGAFAKASGLIAITSIMQVLQNKFTSQSSDVNVTAATRTYSQTMVKHK